MDTVRRSAWLACLLALVAAFAAPARAAAPAESGTLRVAVADDFAHGRAQVLYRLEADDGRRLDVQFDGPAPRSLHSGVRVRLHGRVDGTTLRVPDVRGAVEVLADAAAAAPALPAPQKRRVLAILTDIRDSNAVTTSVDGRCDGLEDQTAGLMFGGPAGGETVDGAYLDSSYGLEGVGGATYPGGATDVVRVLIDQASAYGSVCDPYVWAEAADAAATTAGINLGAYQHRLYVLPPDVGCPWGGLGQVECGDNCRAWESTYSFYPCGTRGAHAHELGHNRGMLHASTDVNNDGTVDGEYGDYSDFMGGNVDELQQNNAPHKLKLGWVDPATVVDATVGGTYTLSALELANAPFPRVLKLVPQSGSPVYLSYRAGIGYDATMPYSDTYLGRTSVHRWAGGFDNTLLLATLGNGVSFGDAGLGVNIRQTAHDAQTATVEITHIPTPTLSVTSPSIAEGNSGSRQLTFGFTLSAAVPWPVIVHVQTFDGSATGGSDYRAVAAANFEIPAGSTAVAFPVDVYGDTAVEGNETFELILTGVSGASPAASSFTATIFDDESILTLSDANVSEGNAGTKLLAFTATLSAPAGGPVAFWASTADGTAQAGSDYVARSNVQLSIPAGQLSRIFNVTINGDTAIEQTETLQLSLAQVIGATAGDVQAVGTLINDDGPVLSINDVSVGEGDAGTKVMTFTVSLSQVAPGPVSYSLFTQDGNTTAGVDYQPLNLTSQVIPQGQLAKTHAITINGDTAVEPNELLLVLLRQPTGATIWDSQGLGYVLNDDGPTLSVLDAGVVEGNAGSKLMNVTVQLSQAAASDVTFSIATANGSATAGSDYTAVNLVNQVIPAGQASKVVQVPVAGDTTVEPDETFTLTLGTSPVGATVYDRQAIATIVNDDGPRLSVGDASISEGNSGTKQLAFTVSLSQAAAATVTFNANTQSSTATVGSDFVGLPVSGFSIPAGQLSTTVTVTINGDTAVENDETFFLWLSSPSGAVLQDGQGVGTITNDDVAGLRVGDATVSEGNSGTRLMTFTATLTQAAPTTVTFNANTQGSTATAGSDFISLPVTGFSIPAGQLTKTFTVTINGDTAVEANETFFVWLSSAVGATLQDGQGIGTITNDD
jgi:hypothetical protein